MLSLKNNKQEKLKIKNHLKKGWVIFWEAAGGHKHVNEEEKVVAILSCRFSGERIRFMVQQFYTSLCASHSEKISFINNPEFNPFRANFGHRGRIPCQDIVRAGHNPFLVARLVQNIRVLDLGDGKEKVEWEEIEFKKFPLLPE